MLHRRQRINDDLLSWEAGASHSILSCDLISAQRLSLSLSLILRASQHKLLITTAIEHQSVVIKDITLGDKQGLLGIGGLIRKRIKAPRGARDLAEIWILGEDEGAE